MIRFVDRSHTKNTMTELVQFPVEALLPKKETGVLSFLSKYPEYDGRGTTIAIFDSGVDPGAPGLQITTDGKRKVIHRFDCSGCGDVSTSTIAKPLEGTITGITGRKLKIPSSWQNPSNNFRIGAKRAFDLYPERLRDTMKKRYKEKQWDELHRDILASTSRELSDFENKNDSSLSEPERQFKENIECKIDMLNNMEKKFVDSGPIYDCILFHDGEMWRCCVDTSENGDLENLPVLGEYSKTGDYASLTKECNLNYSFNVHDNGNVLELVGLCSVHGTLVAAIAAANFPDSPAENGVAPGAQIVSLSIGDGRLGSMETGTALIRAMIKVMELSKNEKIHVINMSYGEHSHWSDSGRVGELMTEIVDKYGITWVASAGNHGPALNTVGTPPDISQDVLIGVGAYVSSEMMAAEYSMRQKLPGMPYTWSSRGPTIDGGMGVTVCAPGGAVTSSPNFTLRYSQLCNGTSMSSPHTAGAISLLLSGLIKKQIPYSPYSIKRAIEVTATYLKDVEVFVQGNGLLNVEESFNHSIKYHKARELNVRFNIMCGNSNHKGIFIRSKSNPSFHLYNITIEPYFMDSDNVPADVKINFNMKFALTCDDDYVNSPTHLDLSNTARMFAVKIDVSTLQTGVHSTFIKAFDLSEPNKGPVFKIPITVIVPQELTTARNNLTFNEVIFKPNTMKRHFIHVPTYATWFKLKLTTKDEDTGRFVIHVLQILPRQSCKTLDSSKTVSVNNKSEVVLNFKVFSENTLEIVIAKYWANIGDLNVDYSFEFHGIKPNQPSITMHAADGIHNVEVRTLQGEEIFPSIVLKNSVQIVKSSETKISPLSSRDVIPPSRQIYELMMSFNFTLSKGTEVAPNFSALSNVLYESEFESQFWMLYDNNKQLLGCGDAYPSKYSVKLDKGEYTVRIQIRHEKREYLDRLSEYPLSIQQKLSNSINLDVYNTHHLAVTGGKKCSASQSLGSVVIPYYIAPLTSDKLPSKSNNTAHYLTGYITYAKDEAGKKVDSYPFKYILVENAPKKSTNTTTSSSSSSGDKSKQDELNEAIRDAKIQWLSKFDSAMAEKHYCELSKEYPDYVMIHSSYLAALDPLEPKNALPNFLEKSEPNHESISKLITVCDRIINMVDSESLLAHFGAKTDSKTDSAKTKVTMDQQRNSIIEALTHKGIALCRLILNGNTKQENMTTISDIWKSLSKFVDLSDSKSLPSAVNVLYFLIWYNAANKFYGKTFKYLWKLQEEKSNKDIEDKLIELCRYMRWKHVEKHLVRMIPSKFCNSFKPF